MSTTFLPLTSQLRSWNERRYNLENSQKKINYGGAAQLYTQVAQSLKKIQQVRVLFSNLLFHTQEQGFQEIILLLLSQQCSQVNSIVCCCFFLGKNHPTISGAEKIILYFLFLNTSSAICCPIFGQVHHHLAARHLKKLSNPIIFLF